MIQLFVFTLVTTKQQAKQANLVLLILLLLLVSANKYSLNVASVL